MANGPDIIIPSGIDKSKASLNTTQSINTNSSKKHLGLKTVASSDRQSKT